jgi:pyruvate/2-oxoglutarate dehydrogenase complex dihydrolipoamide acyltransferase (E2) component
MQNCYLTLPELGIDAQPITACLWLVDSGSRVAEGESILEVLAGAANVELPAPIDGVLVEKLVDEGHTLHVGQRLAVIEPETA